MIDYVWVNRALIFQVVIWIFLYAYGSPLDRYESITKVFFYLGSMALSLIIVAFQPQIGYFTWVLMFLYVLFIVGSVLFLSERFNFRESVCLAFLVVYLNSFYWEFFYHIHEIVQWWPMPLSLGYWYDRVPQLARLLPALWLRGRFRFTDLRYLGLGFAVSYTMTRVKLTYPLYLMFPTSYECFNPAHRIICLGLLLITVYTAPQRAEA